MPSPILNLVQSIASTDFRVGQLALLKKLGYTSDKQMPVPGADPTLFVEMAESYSSTRLNRDKAKLDEWTKADILFQLTDDELGGQESLFKAAEIKPGLLQSYLFFAIELKGSDYSRSALSDITRQINRLFPMPVMVLFTYSGKLSIAVINRRQNKREQYKDVLGKVTLIHDVDLTNPHRGHLEILESFSVPALATAKRKIDSFDNLHSAWEEVFNVELLNKKFYRELANWYFWALPQVEFPADLEPDDEKRRATGLIRLLTRLIFCWFLKEKSLIPESLFRSDELNKLLKDFDPVSENSSSYYQAILQNLFFATLNQRMGKDGKGNPYRAFAKDEGFLKNKATYDVNNLYRYEKLFAVPEDEALAQFADIPFLNGGLFECLDRTEEATEKKRYLDGFSRNANKRPQIPNHLFFGSGEIDISEVTGEKKKGKWEALGLISILKKYKFTILENTPIDQEIALDPELLGKVFENLLASYNEETKTTARKQTGSFYTPRPIVDYMVDESLKAHLTRALVEKSGMKEPDAKAGLDILFAYTERDHAFSPAEVATLITAIDEVKVLDPACGSGAFPMGVLHKFVYILGKLDPDNERWKQTQLTKLDSAPMREQLERAFDDNNDDYGRKLYLIENCLYGVDIQPIAIQITKLRFFISLVCDQKTNRNKKDNHGIRPLPNLETKFVAANSLIGLPEMDQMELVDPRVYDIEGEIEALYHSHFSIQRRDQKLAAQAKIKALREEMADLLAQSLMSRKKSEHIAEWDPFDPQASADFFDPHWMFGRALAKGFDVVIGNPPYGANIDALLVILRSRYQGVIQNYADSFKIFFQSGLELTTPNGILAYITPNVFLSQPRYKDLRHYLLRYRIQKLVNLGEEVFTQVVVPVCLSFISNESASEDYKFSDLTAGNKFSGDFSAMTYERVLIADTLSSKDLSLYSFIKLKAGQVLFGDALEIKDAGIQYHRSGIGLKNKGGNDLYERLFSSSSTYFSKSRPVWYGRLIDRYWIQENTDEFFNLTYKQILRENESTSFTLSAFSTVPKIIWRQTASCLRATIDHDARWFRNTIQCAFLNAVYVDKLDIYYILGVVNSRFISHTYNRLVKEAGRVFPQVKLTHVKKLPLAVPSKPKQLQIAKFVHEILQEKQASPAADTSALEHEIDLLIYALYALTPEEIAIVEGSAK